MRDTRVLDREDLAAPEWARGSVALEPRPGGAPPEAEPPAAAAPGWLPRLGEVLREQFRTVGMSLRREFVAMAGLLGLATASIVSVMTRFPTPARGIELEPDLLAPLVLLGALFPLAVWKSEGPGRRGYHRAMPVDHATHALTRSLVGWGWLMVCAAAYLGWAAAMAIGTGGGLDYVGWRWITPLAAATILYTMVTALSLVARHPWRWIAGLAVSYVAMKTVSNAMDALRPLADLMNWVLDGPLGLTRVITGRYADRWWSGTMSLLAWLVIAGGWAAASGAALLAAARRIPEE